MSRAQTGAARENARTISVIVATLNRAALLDECLTHMARQRFEPGDEVIVVDNGSTDETALVIERHRRAFSAPLLGLTESRPGKSHALARAFTASTGDILAFTDDDVNVSDTWIDAIRRAMADPTVALVGGAIEPRWEAKTPRWLQLNPDRYSRLAAPLALVDYGPHVCDLGVRTAMGGNLAVRRSAMLRVGGFDPHLGKLRGTLLSGEDHDFCRRVQSAGLRACYCPEARVRHWVPAERMRLRYFASWFFWSGITNAKLDDRDNARPRSLFGLPLYLVRRFTAGLIRAPLALCAGDTTKAVDLAMDVAFAAGYAANRWGFVNLDRTERAVPMGDAA